MITFVCFKKINYSQNQTHSVDLKSKVTQEMIYNLDLVRRVNILFYNILRFGLDKPHSIYRYVIHDKY